MTSFLSICVTHVHVMWNKSSGFLALFLRKKNILEELVVALDTF